MREKISAKATGTQTYIHDQRLAKEIRKEIYVNKKSHEKETGKDVYVHERKPAKKTGKETCSDENRPAKETGKETYLHEKNLQNTQEKRLKYTKRDPKKEWERDLHRNARNSFDALSHVHACVLVLSPACPLALCICIYIYICNIYV